MQRPGDVTRVDDRTWLAEEFERQRAHLRAVAYRMLGSLDEADDAIQEAWLRASRADVGEVENLRAWLTTIVARISLNMLRARKSRGEEPLEPHLPDLLISAPDAVSPEHEALLADAVGLALLIVLDTLDPAERLAFVLHDMFGVPFEDIAPMIDRKPTAARQLASRARRRIRAEAPAPDGDLTRQREVVDAFFAAAREGDFERLVAVLDPDVVSRADSGALRLASPAVARGAEAVAARAMTFARLGPYVRPALINGAVGVVVVPPDGIFSVMGFTVVGGRIKEINVLLDPERLSRLDLSVLGDG
jgi:RNA polymerase sigma-70 factor (ECF subfamily)